jgi:putative transcriptional regulator
MRPLRKPGHPTQARDPKLRKRRAPSRHRGRAAVVLSRVRRVVFHRQDDARNRTDQGAAKVAGGQAFGVGGRLRGGRGLTLSRGRRAMLVAPSHAIRVLDAASLGASAATARCSICALKSGKGVAVVTPAAQARSATGLSQSQFAALLGVSVRTLQGWEQGRKQPSGAARTLLAIARQNPRAILEVSGA